MTNETKKNHQEDSKAKVLDLQELDTIGGGLAPEDCWSTPSVACSTQTLEWSTTSAGCS